MAKYNETLATRITTLIAEELCSVSDICKATGISRNTFYKWKRENPAFSHEIEDAMEYRSEVLLSMAYSSIKQRLERHTIAEEKDTYIPDETDSGNLKFKSRIIRKKERLPDLRTIKMILDRADKKIKDEKLKIKNEEAEVNCKAVGAGNEGMEIKNGENESFAVKQEIPEQDIIIIDQQPPLAENNPSLAQTSSLCAAKQERSLEEAQTRCLRQREPDAKTVAIKNIKNSIKLLNDKSCCKNHRKRKYSIKETA
ncbi:hypothetical protein GGR21_002367 [Dysgonomonas hofstadii]|uniref:Homeodomain phBC6A51-type domain-containing protein n=1 Tax=Dysgonomonas hofstadii TaxID=637886 RepID=A0A840CUE4_9BACT|nr:helix-turn-helix domain-containing protein [Dysgonomonas hofstadii]MBB4036465.1 hypothetical protein [Dysgonomonas hofstadii]